MVLTKSELIGSLQHEAHILDHLAGKVDRAKIDYRPTPKQRSTLELLKYLTIMGPQLVDAAQRGAFDMEAWTKAQAEAETRDYEQTLAAIAAQSDLYAAQLGSMSDADLRTEFEGFGRRTTKGAFLVNLVLSGHAAYRTQLFLYLKANGREELGTYNLWAGMDPPAPAAV